jgi:hypothetical protein
MQGDQNGIEGLISNFSAVSHEPGNVIRISSGQGSTKGDGSGRLWLVIGTYATSIDHWIPQVGRELWFEFGRGSDRTTREGLSAD